MQDFIPNEFKNNVLALVVCGRHFKLPNIPASSFEGGLNKPLVPEIKIMFPDAAWMCMRAIRIQEQPMSWFGVVCELHRDWRNEF